MAIVLRYQLTTDNGEQAPTVDNHVAYVDAADYTEADSKLAKKLGKKAVYKITSFTEENGIEVIG